MGISTSSLNQQQALYEFHDVRPGDVFVVSTELPFMKLPLEVYSAPTFYASKRELHGTHVMLVMAFRSNKHDWGRLNWALCCSERFTGWLNGYGISDIELVQRV